MALQWFNATQNKYPATRIDTQGIRTAIANLNTDETRPRVAEAAAVLKTRREKHRHGHQEQHRH